MDAWVDGRNTPRSAHASLTPLRLEVRAAARADLTDHYVWLASEASLDVAEAMAANADVALFRLLDHPGVGSPVKTKQAELAALRKWKIPGFPRLLIFYLVEGETLSVVRILHGAQDWMRYLEAD